jgi:hypothetical protein
MISRGDTISLPRPPEDSTRLSGFPETPLGVQNFLWRVTRKGQGPWWFGSSMAGRFDLTEPEGTCYLAGDAIAALLEVVGPNRVTGFISRTFLEQRILFRLQVPEGKLLADLTSRRSSEFGLTLEVHSVVPYDHPQAWAQVLRQVGFDGLRYMVRHDPAGGRGIALFDLHGEHTWPHEPGETIGKELVETLQAQSGIKVLDVPRLNQLRLVKP